MNSKFCSDRTVQFSGPEHFLKNPLINSDQDVTSFFVKFAPEGDIESTDDDTAVIKLIDDDLSRDKMYTIKISKNGGKISLYNSQITRPFFFDTQTEREMDSTTDTHTMRRMQVSGGS